MSCFFSKCIRSSEEPIIEFIDCAPPAAAFNCLKPKAKYNVSVVGISFEKSYEKRVRLSPYYTEQREHFLQLQRTPLQTPSISSDNSSYDTVF